MQALRAPAAQWKASNGHQGIEVLPLERVLPPEPWGAKEPFADRIGIYVLTRRYLRSEDEVFEAFSQLADQWERETFLIASPREAAMHPAYQRIIGLGLQAVPIMLERLRKTRGRWFWALAAITHEDPAKDIENVAEAVDAWTAWGRARGYLELAD
jgi:hypothetical protein